MEESSKNTNTNNININIKQENNSFGIKTFIIIGVIVLIIIGLYFNMAFKSANAIKNQNPKVVLETTEGKIIIELYKDKAPITVENFLSYVNDKSYDNTVFHRVIKGFMVQGGGFTEDGKQKPTRSAIKLESQNGLKNEIGTVAMARTMVPDSATNQFFINTANNDFLNYGVRDQGYAVFGKVVEGMDIVTKIEDSKTTTKYGMTDWPIKDIKIISAKVI